MKGKEALEKLQMEATTLYEIMVYSPERMTKSRIQKYETKVHKLLVIIEAELDKLDKIKEVVKFGMEDNPDVPQLYVSQTKQIIEGVRKNESNSISVCKK